MADEPPTFHRRLILHVLEPSSSTSTDNTKGSDFTATDANPAYTKPTPTSASAAASPVTNTADSTAPGPRFAVGTFVYRLSDGNNVCIKRWEVVGIEPPQPQHNEPVYRIIEEEGFNSVVYLVQQHELYNPPAASVEDRIHVEPFNVSLKVIGISLERQLGPGFRYTCAVEEGKVSIRQEWLEWE